MNYNMNISRVYFLRLCAIKPHGHMRFWAIPYLQYSEQMVIPSGLLDMLSIKPSNFVPAGLDPATGVDSKDVVIEADTSVDARLYLPPDSNDKKLPVLIYFHGGGFLLTDSQAFSENYHNLVNAIVAKSNVVTVSVNYRLALVQAQLPAAWDDSLIALKWVFSKADPWLAKHGDFEHVFIAGDSAGANITHNLTMLMSGPEGEGMGIEGAVLLCPYFWGSKLIGTETPLQNVLFTTGWKLAMGEGMTLDDPRVNPIVDGGPSLAGLGCKRAFVCVGGEDPLVWRGRTYGEALEASGWEGMLEMKEYEGEDHVFFLDKLEAENSKDLIARLAAFFNPSSITGGK